MTLPSTVCYALPLLAGSSDDIGKILVPIVVVAIWVIGAIIAASQKKKGPRKSKSWEEILRELAGAPPQQPSQPPPPPPPAPRPPPFQRQSAPSRHLPPQRTTRPPSPAPMRPKVRPARPKLRRQPSRALLMAEPLAEADSSPHTSLITPASADVVITTAATPAPTHARGPKAADARAIHRWLTPTTLRTLFVLTEILQPPLAIRDPDRL